LIVRNNENSPDVVQTLQSAKHDPLIQELHLLLITFTPCISQALVELLYHDDRPWKTVLFVRCRLQQQHYHCQKQMVDHPEMLSSYLMPVLVHRVEQLVWNQTTTCFGPYSAAMTTNAVALTHSNESRPLEAPYIAMNSGGVIMRKGFLEDTFVVPVPSPPLVLTSNLKVMMDRLKTLVIRQSGLSVAQALALGRALSRNGSIQELDLRTTRMENSAAEALAKGLIGGAWIRPATIDVEGRHSDDVSSSLLPSCSLKYIDLTHCKLTDGGVAALVDALTIGASSSPAIIRVTTLKLGGNKIGPLSVTALAKHLEHPDTCLQQLDLSSSQMPVSYDSYNSCSSSASSSSVPCSIHEFVIVPTRVTHSSSVTTSHRGGSMHRVVEPPKFGLCNVAALAKAISTNATLRTLNLARNALHQQDALDLAQALAHSSQTSLHELNLSFNHISDTGIEGFAALLPSMQGLRRLALNPNPMTAARAGQAVLQGLQSNYRLEYLDSLLSLQSPKLCNQIRYMTHLNRGGRRILHTSSMNDISLALWPTLLARANQIAYFSTDCSDQKNRIDVLYHLLTNAGPTLFSMAT
jgi:hypothetical protein